MAFGKAKGVNIRATPLADQDKPSPLLLTVHDKVLAMSTPLVTFESHFKTMPADSYQIIIGF